LRIVFDKNVPVGVRRFLPKHEVRTFAEMQWHPQLENGELLGSNIWPIVRGHGAAIAESVDAAAPGSYDFIEMPLPPKRQRDGS
jgi:hypothetical protein